MVFENFDLLVLYKAIELFLLFWLLALLFKWVIYFIFGSKGAKIIGFIGYAVNFAIKKFLLEKIFKIEVYESNPFSLTFKHQVSKRWDILFTSLLFIPMTLGLILGTFVGTIGLLLNEELIFLSIVLYIIGFLISVNSVPTFQDVKELKECSIRSIIIWFIIATFLCASLAAILIPFIQILGIIVAVFFGILLTSILTFFLPIISEKMTDEKSESFLEGTVDLDA
jgi:hypothetical protein